ncbi:MAG: hypothetical protein FJ398_07330 [Verrucomicrobia bacterium]|nr:hypothetical protein [Verrucomicrobiota bacterium]
MDCGEHIASGPGPHGTARTSRRETSPRPPQLSRSALGRKLDQLMVEPGTPGPPVAVAASPATTSESGAQIGPGLNSLLQGSKTLEIRVPATAPEAADGSRLIRGPVVIGSLAAADLLLVAQAVWVAFGKPEPVSFAAWMLVFASIALGAWLGSLAILIGSRAAAPRSERTASNVKR